MLRIAIVDDEDTFCNIIYDIVNSYFSESDIKYTIEKFNSVAKLLESTGMFDIAFLDVEMPTKNGIQVGYDLKRMNPDIVLFIVTSHLSYLDDAMDLQVFRYLEKPVEKERVFRALDIITERETIVDFSSHGKLQNLKADQIVCIYTSLRKNYILTDTGTIIPTGYNIKRWKDIFRNNANFSSPHYSYLINLRYVSKIDNNQITVCCKNGSEMVIYASQRRISQFKKDFIQKMGERH